MPLLGTRGAASARGFGFGSTSTDPYFLARNYAAESAEFFSPSMESVASTVYVRNSEYGNYAMQICRRRKDGTLVWGNHVFAGGTESGNQITNPRVGLSASGEHLWWTGTHQQNNNNKVLIKINPTTGAVIHQRQLGTSDNSSVSNVFVDSTGDAYVITHSGSSFVYVAKIRGTDAGVIWQKRFEYTNRSLHGYGITVAGGNVYAACHVVNNAINVIAVLNATTGATVGRFQHGMPINAGESNSKAITDSSGNVYFMNTAYYGSNWKAIYVTKFITSNNSIGWSRYFYNDQQETTPNARVGSLVMSPDNTKLYVVGGTWRTSSVKAQWARVNASTGSVEVARSLEIQGQDDTYLTGAGATSTHLYAHGFRSYFPSVVGTFIAVPVDGSRQYTTSPYTYQSTNSMQSSSYGISTSSTTDLIISDTTAITSSSAGWNYSAYTPSSYQLTPI
jgi:hypothetical protein